MTPLIAVLRPLGSTVLLVLGGLSAGLRQSSSQVLQRSATAEDGPGVQDALGAEAMGKLARRSFPKQDYFQMYDSNNDGKISMMELMRRHRLLDAWHVAQVAGAEMECADANHDGVIEPSEFSAAWGPSAEAGAQGLGQFYQTTFGINRIAASCVMKRTRASWAELGWRWSELDRRPRDDCITTSEVNHLYYTIIGPASIHPAFRGFVSAAFRCLDTEHRGCLNFMEFGCLMVPKLLLHKGESCPETCECWPGEPTNGGQPVVLLTKMCPWYCTHEFEGRHNGLRFCGVGPNYELPDSINCTGCGRKQCGASPFNLENLRSRSGQVLTWYTEDAQSNDPKTEITYEYNDCVRSARIQLERDFVFAEIDMDDDGRVSKSEYVNWYGVMPYKIALRQVLGMFKQEDADSDQFLSKEEFRAWPVDAQAEQSRSALRAKREGPSSVKA